MRRSVPLLPTLFLALAVVVAGSATMAGGADSTIRAQTAPAIDYFALGDSIASGHGLGDDTKDGGDPNGCRRSAKAYPSTVKSRLEQTYEIVTFAHLACSGATALPPYSPPTEPLKLLPEQVNEVLARLSDRPTLVSITIGSNDYNFADPAHMVNRLFVNDEETFRAFADTIATQVRNAVADEAGRLLMHPNVAVIITEVHNPFNTSSIFFTGWDERLGCALSGCYDRVEYAVDGLNTALRGAAADLGVADRLAMTDGLREAFQAHAAPEPSCGGDAPETALTWIQYRDDPNSNSFPPDIPEKIAGEGQTWQGDCIHPSEPGAKQYASVVVEAASNVLPDELAESSEDVPMFRGNPARTGEMPGPGPVGEPLLQWRVPLGREVVSSPAVVDGVIYLPHAGGDSDQWVLSAFDAASGAEVWHSRLNDASLWSPAVADGVVYLCATGGVLYAFDAVSGAEVWRFQTVDGACTTSPVVSAGIVYAGGDLLRDNNDGQLYAVDARSGEERWHLEGFGHVDPAVADGVVYVVDDYLHALDALTGTERWRVELGFLGALAVANGLVYATGFNREARNGLVIAVDTATGAVRWRFEIAEQIDASLAVANGLVYVAGEVEQRLEVQDGGVLYAIDAMTGSERWRTPNIQNIDRRSSPAVVDGIVYVATQARKLFAEDESTGEAILTSRQPGLLYAFDAVTGAEKWRFRTIDGGGVHTSPVVVNGFVYVGTSWGFRDGHVSGELLAVGDALPPAVPNLSETEIKLRTQDAVEQAGTYRHQFTHLIPSSEEKTCEVNIQQGVKRCESPDGDVEFWIPPSICGQRSDGTWSRWPVGLGMGSTDDLTTHLMDDVWFEDDPSDVWQLVGAETLDERPVYLFRHYYVLAEDDGEFIYDWTMWIDAATFLPLKFVEDTTASTSQPQTWKTETVYSDFGTTIDLQVPPEVLDCIGSPAFPGPSLSNPLGGVEPQALAPLLASSPFTDSDLPPGFTVIELSQAPSDDLYFGAVGEVHATVRPGLGITGILYLVFPTVGHAEGEFQGQLSEIRENPDATVFFPPGFAYPAAMSSGTDGAVARANCVVQIGNVLVIGISQVEDSESQAETNATDLARAGVAHLERLVAQAP